MRIDVFIHQAETAIESKLDEVLRQQRKIMANIDDLKTELAAANETTNEIAADLTELVTKLSTGLSEAETQEVKTEITALTARLRGVASQYTPEGGSPTTNRR